MKMDPPCCTPEDTLRTAARLMTASGADFLPVVEPHHNGRLIGAVTASKVAAGAAEVENGPEAPVAAVMSPDPLCCSIEDDLETVRELMNERGVSAVPVVDDWGCCIGIVAGEESQRTFVPRSRVTATPARAKRATIRFRSTSSSSSVSTDRDALRH
ncbi:MAG: CBS domain-containing protein [Acidobacteria bacterium]|nr:CBS domain-containing protein [Acidobacteriota bacterium]